MATNIKEKTRMHSSITVVGVAKKDDTHQILSAMREHVTVSLMENVKNVLVQRVYHPL